MEAICKTVLNIALISRSNSVSYTWVQKRSVSSIAEPEYDVIGAIAPKRYPHQGKPWRVIFGGVIKGQGSDDHISLTKLDVLVP